jgi:vacuolar-type H+-ATPase catalytic subunit A/Vma1
MSFSCPTKTALTDSELGQTFGNGITPGLLPSTPTPSSERDTNGMLTDTAVKAIVASLKGSGIIPTATTKNTDTYVSKQASLLKNIQSEYCFYDSRYKYSLQKLFDAIRQGYSTNTADNQTLIQKYLASTQALNQRLNDLTQIVNAVTDDMLSSSTNLAGEIRAFNNQISMQQKKLQEQNKIISSGEAATKLNKQMVRFTEEKARYSDNLLKLYSFLNIVALGLLVYVYKSAAD